MGRFNINKLKLKRERQTCGQVSHKLQKCDWSKGSVKYGFTTANIIDARNIDCQGQPGHNFHRYVSRIVQHIRKSMNSYNTMYQTLNEKIRRTVQYIKNLMTQKE